MKILLTGAAGFIGSFTARKLISDGHEVLGIDNFDSFYSSKVKELYVDITNLFAGNKLQYFEEKEVQPILDKLNSFNNLKQNTNGSFELKNIDICDYDSLAKLFETYKLDAIIHLAGMAGVPYSILHPRKFTVVNVDGTVNLLELAAQNNIKNFVFASSSSVYGNLTQTPFKETDETDKTISPYAATKRMGEIICHTYSYLYNMDIACLRFFTVFGPMQRPKGMAIQRFIKQASDRKPFTVYGDGSMSRDYTYIDDIVDGIIRSMEKNKGYNIYNLGNTSTISMIDLTNIIGDKVGFKEIAHIEKPNTEVPITFASVDRAKKDLGYEPKTKIEDGIYKQIEVYEILPDWYKELAD